MSANVLNVEARADATRHGRNLAYLTIGWNSLEAVAAIVAGALAGSIALVGFGVDSVIEVSSGAIILWRLFSGDHREKLALKLVGITLIALAAYVGFDAVKSLLLGGLLLNAVFGWWWADPIAAVVMLPIIAKEGIDAMQGETCCDSGGCH